MSEEIKELTGVEKFHEEMKDLIKSYKELDFKARKINKYKSYYDELYKPYDDQLKKMRGTFYIKMLECGLGGYCDDDIKLSTTSGYSKYVLANGVDDKIRDLLISKGYIVEAVTSGYCKARVIDPELEVPRIDQEAKDKIDQLVTELTPKELEKVQSTDEK